MNVSLSLIRFKNSVMQKKCVNMRLGNFDNGCGLIEGPSETPRNHNTVMFKLSGGPSIKHP